MRHVLRALGLLLLPTLAAAQSAALRDSLAALRAPSEVRPFLPTESDDAASTFRRGLVLLRLHELSGDWHDAVAAKEAFVAAFAAGLEADGLFGLALAALQDPLLRPGERRVLGPESWDGRRRAVAALQRALALRPGFAEAAALLGELALEDRSDELVAEAVAAADRALEHGAATPGAAPLLVVRSRLAERTDDTAGAAAFAEAAAAAGGGAAARLALARARFAAGDAAGGGEAWRAGLADLDGPGAEAFRSDFAPLLDAAELEAWTRGSARAREALLRGHVERRAAAAGIAEDDLLLEHYRRLEHARRHFRRGAARGAPPSGAMVLDTDAARPTPFDDRGTVWVRHGPPDEVLRTTNQLARPNETWVYHRADGRTELFHFALLPDAPDWRLIEDLFAAIEGLGPLRDPRAAEALGDMAQAYPEDSDLLDVVGMLEDRASADPRYGTMAGRLLALATSLQVALGVDPDDPSVAANRRAEVDEFRFPTMALASEERQTVLAALEGADHTPRFAAPLTVHADFLTFRGDAGRTDVVAAAAIAGGGLTLGRGGASAAHGVRVGLGVEDPAEDAITRTDTAFHLAVHGLVATDEFVRLHVAVAAPPAPSARARLVLRDGLDPARGAVVDAALEVPDYRAAPLMLSDLVLAEADSGGAWRRGGVALALVPHGQFAEDAAFRLFYEVYGLAPGEVYRTEIRLEPLARPGLLGRIRRLFGGGPGVHLRFEEEAAPDGGGTVRELRRVEHGLAPGPYRLVVRVTTAAGVSAERGRTLSVRPAG